MLLRKPSERHELEALISPHYLGQLTQKHATDPHWGTSGDVYLERVVELAHKIGAESILDYGCGKGNLVKELVNTYEGEISVIGYDPAVRGFDKLPESADLVVCTDVLEHIEPDHLQPVLTHIAQLAGKGAFMAIHTGPAVHKLPDGRNAHLIQQGVKWWIETLSEHFIIECADQFDGQTFILFAMPWTEERLETLGHKIARAVDQSILTAAGAKDPEPDLSKIEEVDRGSVKVSGMLGSFGGSLSYKDE